jgi:hypothetical protein
MLLLLLLLCLQSMPVIDELLVAVDAGDRCALAQLMPLIDVIFCSRFRRRIDALVYDGTEEAAIALQSMSLINALLYDGTEEAVAWHVSCTTARRRRLLEAVAHGDPLAFAKGDDYSAHR